jgi:hypothetical protein
MIQFLDLVRASLTATMISLTLTPMVRAGPMLA